MTASEPRFRRYPSEVRGAMLVGAGLACLAEGGITAFTIDNICRKAGASRGLITHHFGSKDGLLLAVHAAAYAPLLANLAAARDLAGLIDRMFQPAHFNRDSLNIWLALWGEIATNPALQAEHRRHYADYRARVVGVLAADGVARAEAISGALIALVDGLWLEQCLAPDIMSPTRAKAACKLLLGSVLRDLQGSGVAQPAGANSAKRNEK